MSEKEDDYSTIRIPKELSAEMDNLIGKLGFRSKAEIVKEAIRRLLNHYQEVERALPRFEKVNNDENGVKILDRSIHELVEIYVTPKGIQCSYDKTDECEHIDFALSFPEVKSLFKKHRKEGWKLPDV